jgi:hypothetical protein
MGFFYGPGTAPISVPPAEPVAPPHPHHLPLGNRTHVISCASPAPIVPTRPSLLPPDVIAAAPVPHRLGNAGPAQPRLRPTPSAPPPSHWTILARTHDART